MILREILRRTDRPLVAERQMQVSMVRPSGGHWANRSKELQAHSFLGSPLVAGSKSHWINSLVVFANELCFIERMNG